MVLSLDRMCQCGLHAVLWSHIGTLMHRLAAEPRSTTGLLLPFLCPSGTILLTQFSMVWDWRVSRAGPMLLYWPKLLYIPTIVFYSLSLSLLSVYKLVLWAWVFWLIGCISLSPSLALLTFSINNNNNKILASYGFLTLLSYHWAENEHYCDSIRMALLPFSVYIYTEHCIATVLLNYSIFYKNGINIVT